MQLKLIVLLLFSSYVAAAQQSDILLLKKKKKIITLFTKGTQIAFLTKKGVYKDAQIRLIKNDTIYLKEYLIQRIPTTLGFFIVDTLGSLSYAYHYNDIYKFNKEQKNFNVSGTAGALLGGGTLLTVGSGIVYLADKNSFSLPLFTGGVAATSIGYLLMKKINKGIIIGKNNYHLQYLKMATAK